MSMAALSILTRPYSLTPSSLGLYDFNHHNRFNVINYKFNSSLSPTKSNNRASRLYHMPTYFSQSGNFSWYKRWDFQINFSVSLLFLIQKFSFSNWLLREWWNEKKKNWRIKYNCFMYSESTKHSSFNKISCLKNLNLSSILAPVFYFKFYHYIYGTWISLRSKFHIF